MELLAALLTACCVLSLLMWVFGGHRQAVAQRLAALDPEQMERIRQERERRKSRLYLLNRAAGAVGRRLLGLLPVSWVGTLRDRLAAAGRPVTPAGFMVLTVIFAALGAGAVLVLLSPALGLSSPRLWLLAALLGVLGTYLPHFWLSRAVRLRRERIVAQLPDGLDLMTTCVEAGLGLDAAMSQVSTQLGGPLGEELQITLGEVALGRRRADALVALAERVNTDELTSFVQALTQADQLGVSIGQVLRVQSDVIRTKYRQRVEQKVYQAPVKMLFPLVLFIFPAMFVVILGSAIIELEGGIFGG